MRRIQLERTGASDAVPKMIRPAVESSATRLHVDFTVNPAICCCSIQARATVQEVEGGQSTHYDVVRYPNHLKPFWLSRLYRTSSSQFCSCRAGERFVSLRLPHLYAIGQGFAIEARTPNPAQLRRPQMDGARR